MSQNRRPPSASRTSRSGGRSSEAEDREYAAGRSLCLDRLANEQEHCRKGHNQRQQAETDIGGAPAEIADEKLGILRNQRRAQTDPAHRYSQRQASPVVKPGRDAFRITERPLARSQNAGDRKEQHEYDDRSRRQGDECDA